MCNNDSWGHLHLTNGQRNWKISISSFQIQLKEVTQGKKNIYYYLFHNFLQWYHFRIHWFGIIKLPSRIEIFDCLVAQKKAILKAKQYGLTIERNTSALMDVQSKFCGEFTIYYLIQRLFQPDYTMKEILKEFFVENKCEMDKKVVNFKKYLQSLWFFRMDPKSSSFNHHSVASNNPEDPLMRQKEQRLKIKPNMKVQYLTVSKDFGKILSP